MQRNKRGTEKSSQEKQIAQKWPAFCMPVFLKSGFIAKQVYIQFLNYGFRFVIAICIFCKCFEFLSFKITDLLPCLWYFLRWMPGLAPIWDKFRTFWDQLLIVWLSELQCTKMWSGQFDLSHLGQICPTLRPKLTSVISITY